MFKSLTVKDWVRFVEAYGQPMRLGKFPDHAEQADKDVLYRAVANIAADAAAIVPEGMDIEFVNDSTVRGRSEVYRDLVTYIDAQLSIAVLGQTLTTQEGDSGSYALGQVHNLVRRDIERADGRQLAAALTRDLAIPIVTLNRGSQAVYPKVVIEREEPADLRLTAEALEKLVPLGLAVRADEVRTQFGFSPPDDDDEILKTPDAATVSPSLSRELDRRLADPALTRMRETRDPIDLAVLETTRDGDGD